MLKKIQRGFTLIELIVVIVILSILAVIGADILQSAFNSYFTNRDINSVNMQAQYALDNMARRIRMIRGNNAITTASGTILTFTDINNNTMTYRVLNGDLQLNGSILASNVSNFALSYLDRNGNATTTLANIRFITINLTITENNVAYSYRTTIYPRNLP